MKDNLPNYLNPHNIEPFIPTKNAADGTENRTNDVTDINDGKMSYAEAIRILEQIETDIYGRIAIGKAIDALKEKEGKIARDLYQNLTIGGWAE